MDRCKIEIATTTEGARNIFCASGSVQKSNGAFVVTYMQDGDEVTLTATPLRFTMARRGDVGLYGEFGTDGQSRMRLISGGTEGEIPVRTTDYSLSVLRNGCTVRLQYDLIFPQNLQTFRLNIFFGISEEE